MHIPGWSNDLEATQIVPFVNELEDENNNSRYRSRAKQEFSEIYEDLKYLMPRHICCHFRGIISFPFITNLLLL